ncbi:MAG TPA: hypothetical protein VGD52_11320 [Pseudoduganella sp.]
MRRYRPVLQIAVVSSCEYTACALAERINERGQFVHVFASAKELCEFPQLQVLDLVMLDRRPGFAMTLSALRAYLRSISCYAMFCGLGRTQGVIPAGVDYSISMPLTDAELGDVLDDVLHTLDGDLQSQRPEGESWQMMCQ